MNSMEIVENSSKLENGDGEHENGHEEKVNGSNGNHYDYSDDDVITDSDSELDDGPPPMIRIDKSADVDTIKSAFMNKIDKRIEKDKVIVSKDNLTSLASTFEKGGVDNATKIEREKPSILVDKEQYSSVKDKFENIEKVMANKEEERKTLRATEIQGAGVESLMKAKDLFEKNSNESQSNSNQLDRKIEIERSEADKKRVQKAFFETNEKEFEPKECAVCRKMVYSVEKMQLEKKIFHQKCFKCCKCQKSLNVQNYTTCEGQLYCKLHIMEKFNPDIALSHELAENKSIDDDEPDEEEDYAVVTRPKALDPSIVRSGLKSTDDFENIPNLKDKKKEWASSVEQSGKIEKRTEIDADMFQHGKVKARMSKFVEGESFDRDAEGDDCSNSKESRKKEEIKIEIGAKSLKNKWESGTMESVQGEIEDRSQELNELKKNNVSIKDRFKEKSSTDDESSKRKTMPDDCQFDNSSIHAAKERFLRGDSFQESSPVERRTSKDDLKFSELTNVKERFEQRQSSEDHLRTDHGIPSHLRCSELVNLKSSFEHGGKKKFTEEELEAKKKENLGREFKRIQKEKRILKEKELREAEQLAKDLVTTVPYEDPDDVRQCAEMGSIKQRFEEGIAYKTEITSTKKFDEDLEIKVASKARQKFMQIDQDGGLKDASPLQLAGSPKDSKWSKESGPLPEPINRKIPGDYADENPEDFEVKNLLNKFKNIEQGIQNGEQKAPKPVRQITPPPADYKSELISEGKERDPNIVLSSKADEAATPVKVEAKSLKAKFENVASTEKPEDEAAEEKRRHLEQEFKQFKELKESQKQDEPENDESTPGVAHDDDPNLAIAAEHAQKMRAKWDKIQRKEAKKAQKSASMRKPAQTASRFRPQDNETCAMCQKKVYLAERIECNGHWYHKICFKCTTCNISLRLENCTVGSDHNIYCQTHYKALFNDLSHPLSHGPSRDSTPPIVTNGFLHE